MRWLCSWVMVGVRSEKYVGVMRRTGDCKARGKGDRVTVWSMSGAGLKGA